MSDYNSIQDLSQFNVIDTECKSFDEDGDSFASIPQSMVRQEVHTANNAYSVSDTANDAYKRDTGIIIDLSDDDEPLRTISADISYVQGTPSVNITRNYSQVSSIDSNYNDDGYNAIDMETAHYDDTEDMDDTPTGLIDEAMLDEKKTVNQGTVEADYLARMQKKHAKTVKPGAYNTHFHFSGDPAKEAEIFNHDMSTTNAAGSGSLVGSVSSAGDAGGAGGAGGESLTSRHMNGKAIDARKVLLEELFAIIGFDVIPDSDEAVTAFDLCDKETDIHADNMPELLDKLYPYIDTCLICPLEVSTGQSFDTYDDWCSWYDSDDNKTKYPSCAKDIEYCRVLRDTKSMRNNQRAGR